jgi:hypothetical protein
MLNGNVAGKQEPQKCASLLQATENAEWSHSSFLLFAFYFVFFISTVASCPPI